MEGDEAFAKSRQQCPLLSMNRAVGMTDMRRAPPGSLGAVADRLLLALEK